MLTDLVIGMAGSGGDGIVSAGDSLMAAAAADGFHAIMTKSFGPQIRGGESSCRVRIATHPIFNPGGVLDVAVALNWDDWNKFSGELVIGAETIVIYEQKTGIAPDALPVPGPKPTVVFPVPISELARKTADTDKAKNTIVLGLLAGWFGLARESALNGIRKRYGKKSPELLAANEKAFAAGVSYAEEHPLPTPINMSKAEKTGRKLLTDGNDMCGAAAIFAGCQFFGGYPITPSTEIMQYLTREIWKYGGAVLQAEDEIAGIGAAVGASFAGKKAMTATSGPGLSLKTELMGLASIAELPLVIVDVQRGGPSTGLPTKSEQSDLFAAALSAHGDVLRPVLAPTSAADTFAVTVHAFNIAERYQTPVLVLSDQDIAQRKEAIDPIDTSKFPIENRLLPGGEELTHYKRFTDTPSGISPISHPGMAGGNYLGSGIEHNEHGDPTANGVMHAKMNEKRFRKLAPLKTDRQLFQTFGPDNADLGLVSWGASAGVCREAIQLAARSGVEVKLLVPYLLYPISEELFLEFFESVRAGLVVEQSFQGQFYRLLRMHLDVPARIQSYCRSGASPFRPSEIVERLRHVSQA